MDAAGNRGRAALVVLAFAGVTTASAPVRVQACSCMSFGIIRSTPLHDATDVPIDVAPVIAGSFDPDQLSFERADGTPVDFEVRAGHGGNEPCVVVSAELVPAQVLDIETQYVIRTHSAASSVYPPHAVRFTTGSGRVPEVALEAPAVAAAFAYYGGSCGTVTGCIRIEGAEQAEIVLHAEGAEPVLLFASGAERQLRGFFDLPECIEVRARDAAGRRSEATMLCGDDFATGDAMDSFGSGALCPESVGHDDMADPNAPGATTGGCSAAAPSGGSGWHSLLLALLAVLHRRRVRSRSVGARRRCAVGTGGIRARFDVATLTIAAALLGGVAALPSPARACSCAPLAIEWSEPADGAVGVPIDIAPILGGWFDPETVAFEHEDGTPVAFALRTGDSFNACGHLTGELVPATALAANSRYVIRAAAAERGEGDSQISFTTGEDRVPELPLVAPDVAVSFVRGNLIMDSCTSDVRGCLTVVGAEHAELRLTRGDHEQIWTFVRGTVQLDTLLEGEPGCVEVRARDAAGRRSAVTTRCGDDLSIRDSRESDYEEYELRCENGVIGEGDVEAMQSRDAGPDDDTPDGGRRSDARHGSRSEIDMSEGGCSASGSSGGRAGSHALLLALLLGLRMRARYRKV